MEAGESLATTLLTSLGFGVGAIPVANGQTADLLVTDSESQQYLIEVKDKLESDAHAQDRINKLNSGGLYEQADPLSLNNRISGKLQKARKQLDAMPKKAGTFQIVWFHATGLDADLKREQAFATFYGHVPLIALSPTDKPTPCCFYFDYSAAYNMRTVEALILTEGEKTLQVCLNEFSHRAEEFRRSELCRTFGEMGGVVDPIAIVASGNALACRSDVSRKNSDDVCKALQTQTGVLYSPIRFKRHAVSVVVGPNTRRAKEE